MKANWVSAQLRELLLEINEVPFTDDREKKQLAILIKGFSELNSRALDKAATKTRKQLKTWNLEEAATRAQSKSSDDDDDGLTRLRPV
ncbi:hypothetical protein ACUR5C_13425 [Aliikangiella sp. IMCC44653]